MPPHFPKHSNISMYMQFLFNILPKCRAKCKYTKQIVALHFYDFVQFRGNLLQFLLSLSCFAAKHKCGICVRSSLLRNQEAQRTHLFAGVLQLPADFLLRLFAQHFFESDNIIKGFSAPQILPNHGPIIGNRLNLFARCISSPSRYQDRHFADGHQNHTGSRFIVHCSSLSL